MPNPTRFRLLDTGLISAAENMALDEVLTRRAGAGLSPPTLRFLRFKPQAAMLGFHQEAARELRLDYCRAQGIDVNRRLTGGGALLFQSSCLGWELIAPMGSGPFRGGHEAALTRICTSAARAFSRLGVEAAFRPRNDIEVEGRKISGTGGMALEGGMLFQGTVLVRNRIERFLKSLRVPVEKLRKREIESLMQRLAFLEDLIGPVDMDALKAAIAEQLAQDLGLELTPGGLDDGERAELADRLPYFQSDQWIFSRQAKPGSRGGGGRPAWLQSILQTDEGNLRVSLWLDAKGKRIQRALITGDFFSQPQRLIMDLEAALMGRKADPDGLAAFTAQWLAGAEGGLLGITPEEVARAVALAAARRQLTVSFSEAEAAELFLVNLEAADIAGSHDKAAARWLLLPYCSKPPECEYRFIPDCAQCGECQFGPLYGLAAELELTPVSVQSFEHLMENLTMIRAQGGAFVGSCCEAFYCKHQKEMEAVGAPGVLINLDSTTCYDLGKGMEAYAGHYDNQTEMNQGLIEKVCRLMARPGDRRAA